MLAFEFDPFKKKNVLGVLTSHDKILRDCNVGDN